MKNLYHSFLVALIMLLGTIQSYAQLNITTPDTTICLGTTLPLNATIGSSAGEFVIFTDDIFSSVAPLGFNFTFYGNTYSSTVISSNGFLTFNLANAGQPSEWDFAAPNGGAVPGNQYVRNSIMGPYMDIDPSAGGTIEYSTQGTAPNRRFVVTFCNTPMFSCVNVFASFQMVLFETTNQIEIHISNKPACDGWNSGGAIEGVQNAAGTSAVTVPGRNYPTNWTAANSSHRFTPNGTTYTVSSIPFSFYPTGLTNITWYDVATSAIVGTGQTLNVSPTSATSYRAVAQGCIGSSADTVTVNTSAPVAPPAVSTPVSYCQFDAPVPLSATGSNLLWYTQATGGTATATPIIPSTQTAGFFTYYVSQSIGCESPRAPIVVNVFEKPASPAVADISTCVGYAESPLIAGGQNLLWYNSPIGGTGSPVAPTPATTSANTQTFYVSQSINGCEGDRAAITVTVNDAAFAQIDLDTNFICAFEPVGFTSTGVNPTTALYSWNFDGVGSLSGNGAGPYQGIWNTPGIKNIVLVVTNGTCMDTATAQLTVSEAPNADFVLQDHTCINDTIFVQAAWDARDAENYTWDFGDAQVINGSGPGYYKVRWNTPGLKAITLVTDNGGCKSPVITEGIVVHEAPVAQINIANVTGICAGDTIEVSAAALGDKYSYDWTPSSFFNGFNGAVYKAKILRSGNISLTVRDQYGCPGTDSVFIAADACCTITVPNAFTPNNDGLNDRFGIITAGNNELLSFRIQNRWGQTIFETTNPGNKWDGTFMNTLQPLDNYHYYIKYKCGNGTITEKKGDLTLLR